MTQQAMLHMRRAIAFTALCLAAVPAFAGDAPAEDSAGKPAASVAITAADLSQGDPADLPERARAPLARGDASALSAGGITVSANVTLASEYRFRGIDLSGGDPAVQGGIDIGHDSGFYAGSWASTLDEATVGYGALELDFYGGWSGPVGEGLTANIGVIAYTFPDAPAGDFDYYELYGSLGFTLGPAQARIGAAWDPAKDGLEFGGLRRDNLYLYTDLSAGVPGTAVTVSAHLGYTDGAIDFAGDSQSFDWSLGADYAIRGTPLTFGLAYVDAAEDVATGAFNPTSGTVVATLTAGF